MKKIVTVGLSFLLMLIGFFVVQPADKAFALSYDFTNPYSTGCSSKSPITYETKNIYKNGTKIGYVQLRGSAYCHTAWGRVVLNSAAPYNAYANVGVYRYYGSASTSNWNQRAFCNSKGGNGLVNKGQTSCYTGQLWDKDPYNSLAVVYIYSSDGRVIAQAQTGRH
ncbi:uncharacterized protein DUF2690 [Neobacillus bataviensis]|uniref:Uncharacterized protein DUF2690 n=1 Tax=Neobacillus bataviensis TaxID=220685 RepID=A0A561DC85_9BACI|nr:DUF2690 domain-containing protein [Neobacillus bataviensis]TWE01001.1 uncharacterized protein DUF2690 [Neobacillus bataviensis]